MLAGVDFLVVPTTPTIYRIDEVEAEPRKLNAQLGAYTNFVNLLDLAAVAVPAGFRDDGLPAGVTLVGPAGSDAQLAAFASALHRATSRTLGATGLPLPEPASRPPSAPADSLPLAVVGAHLSGEPLNHQLIDAGGVFVRAARTAPRYRLYALPDTSPPKPGLVRARAARAPPSRSRSGRCRPRRSGASSRAFRPRSASAASSSRTGAGSAGSCARATRSPAPPTSRRYGGWRAYLRSLRLSLTGVGREFTLSGSARHLPAT